MIKVCHDDLEALVFLSNQIFDRDLDIFEGDVGGTA
jgi:hypothetical protein